MNYLPVFNIVSVPIMCITLRNNLMVLIYGSNSDPVGNRCNRVLWTLGLSIPCFIVTYLQLNTLLIFNISAGMVGVLILGMKGILVHYARKHDIERKVGHPNPLKSYFQHKAWIYVVLIITGLLLGANIFYFSYRQFIPPLQFCS